MLRIKWKPLIFIITNSIIISSCGLVTTISRDTIVSTNYQKSEVRKRFDVTEITFSFYDNTSICSIDLMRNKVVDSLSIRKDSIRTDIQHYLKDGERPKVFAPDAESTYVVYAVDKEWTTTIGTKKLSNQLIKLRTKNKSQIDLFSDNNGNISIPLNKLFPNGFTSSIIGTLEISRNDSGFINGNEQILLSAPENLSRYFVNSYTKNRQARSLNSLLVNKNEFPLSLVNEIKNNYSQLVVDSLLRLIASNNFDLAVDLYTSTNRFIKENRFYDDYTNLMIGPNWWNYYENKYDILSYMFDTEKFKRENGNLYRIKGRIIQILENAFLINSDTDNFTWYCITNNVTGRNDLVDEMNVELYGVVMGTKTYPTVMGASKTVPSIRLLGLKANQE